MHHCLVLSPKSLAISGVRGGHRNLKNRKIAGTKVSGHNGPSMRVKRSDPQEISNFTFSWPYSQGSGSRGFQTVVRDCRLSRGEDEVKKELNLRQNRGKLRLIKNGVQLFLPTVGSFLRTVEPFLLTVDNCSFFTYSWSFFCLQL